MPGPGQLKMPFGCREFAEASQNQTRLELRHEVVFGQ